MAKKQYLTHAYQPVGRLWQDDYWLLLMEQYLRKPVGIKRKLERLRKFYKYGLNQAGWNMYSRISVELDNQVICKKRPH